ncbi:MAG: transposase [Rhizonema sp. PD38]|nr:transposase [Rhizonema sp. PD38]
MSPAKHSKWSISSRLAKKSFTELSSSVLTILNSWIKDKFIRLPKIGEVEVIFHRPIPDGFKVKTCIVSKKSDGWYICLSLEDKTVPDATFGKIIPTEENSIGLDAVLNGEVFVANSVGELLPSVKSFRKNQDKLARISRKKAANKKYSAKRRRLAKKEAKLHQKIARSRKEHHFKTSHRLIKISKKIFFVEDLDLKNLTKRNKAKQDESGRFLPNNQAARVDGDVTRSEKRPLCKTFSSPF